jgi:hypothetical protein
MGSQRRSPLSILDTLLAGQSSFLATSAVFNLASSRHSRSLAPNSLVIAVDSIIECSLARSMSAFKLAATQCPLIISREVEH